MLRNFRDAVHGQVAHIAVVVAVLVIKADHLAGQECAVLDFGSGKNGTVTSPEL